MQLFREGPILAGFSDRSDGDLWFPGLSPEALSRSWNDLSRRIGYALPFPRFLTQVHGDRLIEVGPGDGCGNLAEADGLLTSLSNAPIGVFTADCLPLLLAGKNWIAAVHAGWKGTRLDIAGAAARALVSRGERPEELTGFIGPCIGSCCLELGDEVPPTFIQRDPAAAAAFSQGRKWHLDLRGLNTMHLMRVGVRPEQVNHVHACTRCGVDRYFSYRAEHGRQGSMFSFIVRLEGSHQPQVP